jgi:hypothetical protein
MNTAHSVMPDPIGITQSAVTKVRFGIFSPPYVVDRNFYAEFRDEFRDEIDW